MAVVLGLWVAGAESAAAAGACPKATAPVPVRVVTDNGPLRYELRYSQAQIDKILAKNGQASQSIQGKPVGLTQSTVNMEIRTQVQPVRSSSGTYCMWLSNVDVVISYSETVVYIDRKYPRRSCEYNAILAHENDHVTINRETLQRYIPYLTAALQKAANELNPVATTNLNQGRQQPVELLKVKLKPALDTFNNARDRANAYIDTAENYRRTHVLCRNW